MICPRCGTETMRSEFCTQCGTPMKKSAFKAQDKMREENTLNRGYTRHPEPQARPVIITNLTPKKPFFKRKLVWTFIFLMLIVGIGITSSVISENEKAARDARIAAEEARDAELAANAGKILKGMVRVPDTLFKTKELVEAEFETAGLKVKFAVSNFDDEALIYKYYLREGECGRFSDSGSVVYFFSDEVGYDYAGYYAKEGSTVVVGYSDHDFDGTVGVSEAPEITPIPSMETQVITFEDISVEIPAEMFLSDIDDNTYQLDPVEDEYSEVFMFQIGCDDAGAIDFTKEDARIEAQTLFEDTSSDITIIASAGITLNSLNAVKIYYLLGSSSSDIKLSSQALVFNYLDKMYLITASCVSEYTPMYTTLRSDIFSSIKFIEPESA